MESVSAIIPAYNAAEYLGEAVDSALAQVGSAVEVIVVDDGSTDTTPDILAGYGTNIRVLRQTNQGSAAACNTGAAIATGDWLAFLDADDIWLPDKTLHQLRHCGHTVISHTDSLCFGPGLIREIRRSEFEPPYAGWILEPLLVRNFITKSTVMIRREVFQHYGGFDTRRSHFVEDWPFWLKVCAHHELGYLPEVAARYRVHAAGKSMNGRRALRDHLGIIEQAFAANGVGAAYPGLRRRALAASYQINSHYAASTGDWSFALYCGPRALGYDPWLPRGWKHVAKAALLPLGVPY